MGAFPAPDPARPRSFGANATPRRVAGGLAQLARVQGLIGGIGAIIGALGVLLPHPDSYVVAGLLATQFLSLTTGTWLYFNAGRVPVWALSAIPTVATLMVTSTVLWSGDATSPYALFYLWTGMYSFYFLSAGEARLQIGFTAFAYIVVALLLSGSPPAAAAAGYELHFVIVAIATLGGGGFLQVYMRSRVESLVEKLAETATTDLQTGLSNRRGVSDFLATELARARKTGEPVGVLVGDIDNFKLINERIGHEAGDHALIDLAEFLGSRTEATDRVGRTGPAEFTIVMPGCTPADLQSRATALLGDIARRFEDLGTPLTLSFGIAAYPEHGESPAELFRAADSAMYAAKVLGRNRALVHSEQVEQVMRGIKGKRSTGDAGQLATALSLADALDLREGSTARHSETVGRYAQSIARELAMPEKRVERVRLAGVLHDVGKIAIPDSVLCKAGPLTDDEFALMKQHPELGARMLASSELADIREWVLAHHERPDGKGYPRGLSDEEIPVEAKILSVCDAYEAMTADRVYRRAPGHDFAIAELRAGAGTQFDADIVAILERVVEAERSSTRGTAEDGAADVGAVLPRLSPGVAGR